jgi:predicted nucleic acid-binding protein
MIVLDASAVIELLLGNSSLRRRLARASDALAVPHLLDVEVAHVLRRLHGSGELTEQRGQEALADLGDLDLDRFSHEDFLPRVWELRHNLTAYDAVYVALAEALRAPLLTFDKKLANSAGHRARIELLRS